MNKNLRVAHQSPVEDNGPLVLYTESRAASLTVNFNDCGLDSKHLSITQRLTYTQQFNYTHFIVHPKRMPKVIYTHNMGIKYVQINRPKKRVCTNTHTKELLKTRLCNAEIHVTAVK